MISGLQKKPLGFHIFFCSNFIKSNSAWPFVRFLHPERKEESSAHHSAHNNSTVLVSFCSNLASSLELLACLIGNQIDHDKVGCSHDRSKSISRYAKESDRTNDRTLRLLAFVSI